MPVDLDTQLRALGDALLRESAPITVDDLAADHVVAAPAAPTRRRWAAAAAIATAAAALVGIVAVGPAGDSGDVASGPTATEPPVGGILLADPSTSTGWSLQRATAGTDPGDGSRTVYYATDSSTPEEAASLVLMTPAVVGTGGAPDGAMSFTIDVVGESWWWSTSEFDMTVAFAIDGVGYTIEGHGVTEDELRVAAAHVLPSGPSGGARIDAAGLPEGVVERAIGTTIETWFFDEAAVERGLPQQSWVDADGRPMWLTVARGDADLVGLARIGRSSVTDVEVRGRAGVEVQDHGDTEFRSVVWAENGSTYYLGARGVQTDEMLAFAETLRPATQQEWAAVVQDDLPDEASIIGVTSFPLVDDPAAVGLPAAPEASFSAFPTSAGVPGGDMWASVLGRRVENGFEDVIALTVVGTGAVPDSPVGTTLTSVSDPGPYTEYTFDSGGVRIIVQGDVTADVAEAVALGVRRLAGSRGFVVDRTSDGYEEVTRPFDMTGAAGHFPVVSFGDGVSIAVNPSPAAGLLVRPGEEMTPIAIAGRPTYVRDSGMGMIDLASELADGTSLTISASGRSMEEVVAIAEAVQLVDQRTWIERYRPRWVDETGATVDLPAAITVPATDTVPATTLEPDLAAVQQRLVDLGFDPGPVDGMDGAMTRQAVWAFEKLVMGVPREQATGVVTPEIWARMREPIEVVPRRPQGAGVDHVEIYLPEQVMVVFHSDEPVLITHISTGQLDDNGEPAEFCETITVDTDHEGTPLPAPEETSICAISKTPGGIFDVDRFVPGTRVGPLGAMWNPIYFNYGIAIHGAKNVPLEPASHGNVRVPMHVSERLPDLIPIGSLVYVWDGTAEPEDQTREAELPSFPWPDA